MTRLIALGLFVVFVSFYYFQSRAAISGNKPICQGGRLLTSLSRERLPIGMGYPGAPIVEIHAACSAPPHRPSQGSGLRRFSKRDYSRDLRPAKRGSGVSLHGSNPEPLMSALSQKRTLHTGQTATRGRRKPVGIARSQQRRCGDDRVKVGPYMWRDWRRWP
jgi:hypothetical protein